LGVYFSSREFTGAMQDQPATDSIQLPALDAFISTPTSTAAESHYPTLLQELTCAVRSRKN